MQKSIIAICAVLLSFITISVAYGNYLPIKVVNNSQIANDNDVYLFINAKLPTAIGDNACVMRFDSKGYGTCDIVSDSTDLSQPQYNYPLSKLPVASDGNGGFDIFIPKVVSGRIYFSVGQPMHFYVNANNPNDITIPDPDGFKSRDPNYYTLYDKIEFSYTDAGTWINPTAVDFFSLPLGIEQVSSTSGITKSGFGVNSRQQIFYHVNATFTIAEKTNPPTINDWNNLWLSYNGEFTDGTSGSTILRLMAPGKAMESINPLSQNTPFNPNYLQDKLLGFEYINAIWTYYKSNTIKVDASELNKGIFAGSVDADNNFVFTNGTDTVTIPQPKSISFFAGAQGSFDAPNNTPKAIIVRELTSAFEVGLLPAPDGVTLNKTYFEHHKGQYYTANKLLAAGNTGPWYDLYSKALHSIGADQPIYTFAYDDALGQDGTLHDPNADHLGLVTVIIGNMAGAKIPAPSKDNTKYTVYVTVGENSTVTMLGQTLRSGPAIMFAGISAPIAVTFNGQDYQIDIAHPMIRPFTPASDGIVISNNNGTINLTFPGKSV